MVGDISGAFQAALGAASAGKDPMDAAFGPTSGGGSNADGGLNSLTSVSDGEGTGEDEPTTKKDESPVVSVTDAENTQQPTPNVETVVLDGREVKIDYSDREAIKRAHSMAVVSRRWQAERDAALAKVKTLEPDHKDLSEFKSAITGAFEKQGLEGLVNLLTNSEEGYKKFIEAEVSREIAYRGATPEQKALMDERRANEQLKRELEADRKSREEQLKKSEEAKTLAEKTIEEANQTSFFEINGTSQKKFSFAGKLGNADVESALDSKVWTKVKAELESMPDNTDVTPRLMDSIYKKYFDSINQSVSKNIDKKADQKVEEKKKDAQTRLSAAATTSMNRGTATEEFNAALDKGDWASTIRMALGGKVKLSR